MLNRSLQLAELVRKKSIFLFGPRGTGKTSLIRSQLSGNTLVINLLNSDTYLRLSARPAEIVQLIDASQAEIIVIDEVQKIPLLLDEVHNLIETRKLRFLLTGSSARKLKKSGANLLAGRAWTAGLFPLTTAEIPSFELKRYLQFGGLPAVYLSEFPQEELQAYISTYLTEEVAAEGLVRDLPRFSHFLQKAALSNGEILNFSEIASDLGVSPTTVREYYRILEDTLLGYMVEPIRKPNGRKEVSTARFYLFDVGVTNTLRRVKTVEQGTPYFGILFEHFIGQEIRAAISYLRVHEPLKFWRTHSQREVDFIVGEMLAVEVKASSRATMRMVKGLSHFSDDFDVKHRCLVSLDPVKRIENGILFIPYDEFLSRLWAGDWFN